MKPTKPKADIARLEKAIIDHALSYPGVTLEHPWGHGALKVRKKVFLFTGADADGISFSVKLPHSADAALLFPFAEPTGYGLGKSGWVSARFKSAKEVPVPLIKEWLDESYRAIAPKKLSAELDAPKAPATPRKKTAKKRSRTRA